MHGSMSWRSGPPVATWSPARTSSAPADLSGPPAAPVPPPVRSPLPQAGMPPPPHLERHTVGAATQDRIETFGIEQALLETYLRRGNPNARITTPFMASLACRFRRT